MEAYIFDWLNLIIRWAHVITGIAWIGSSFYFMWLDYHLEKPEEDAKKGVSGQLWAVHGGGFYHVQKYMVAPEKLPKTLHRFKWESYTTFVTGFFLLVVLYYYGAELYLIDPKVMMLEPWQAILIGLAFLVVGWFGYDLMCKSPIGKNGLLLAVCGFIAMGVSAFIATHIFSGRGAFIHIGAMLGTIMAANVFRIIIPNQEKVIAAMSRGEAPDPALGKQGKQRSTHNNYMTLPVLFIMISNHYPATFGHRYNWAVMIMLFVFGGLIRHWFNLKNRGIKAIWPVPSAFAVLAVLIVFMAPPDLFTAKDTANAPKFSDVQGILERRCITCHMEKPTFPGMLEAPKGVMLTDKKTVRRLAPLIHQQVSSGIMPLGNVTEMTDAERQIIKDWLIAGANTDN